MPFSQGNTKAKRLTAAQVVDIRNKYNMGMTQAEIARQYSLNSGHVGRIVRGECWNMKALIPDAFPSESEFIARITAAVDALDKPTGG